MEQFDKGRTDNLSISPFIFDVDSNVFHGEATQFPILNA